MQAKPRRILLAVTLVAIVGAILVLENLGTRSTIPPGPTNLPANERDLPAAANFEGGTGWLNTPNSTSLDMVALRGQVVLVDFWTYSCINCIHTLPHITALYNAYSAHGFTVIGVHTPEFGFEMKRENVAKAIQEHGIHYPVVQDNDESIWNAYHNHYWPAHYLIDQYGRIRDTEFGEGSYEKTEQLVRQLLTETNHTTLPPAVEPLGDVGSGTHTPELYVAAYRSAVGNPEGYHIGQNVTYAAPANPQADRIYLVGTWQDTQESATASQGASVLIRFHGGGGNIVLDAPAGCLPIRLDGKAITRDHAGQAVDAMNSCLKVNGADSYDFYTGDSQTHTVEIAFPPGATLYTFDFTG